VELPFTYTPGEHQPVRRYVLKLTPPTMTDQIDDWSRLRRAVAAAGGPDQLTTHLSLLQRLGPMLRESGWSVTAVIETGTWERPAGPARLIEIYPTLPAESQLWGIAVDIGTTTVSLYLVDLLTGQIAAKTAEYNGQIKRGEDVISRMIFAGKGDGLAELQRLVVETINQLIERVAHRAKIEPANIYKMTVAGNSTMIHLLLGLPPASIRLEPFITGINQPPPLLATQLGLAIHPQATVDCLPGVASYVGADITAGVTAANVCDEEPLTLFLDVGTNGETVLGNRDWLITCACSAGPAFEGAGVHDGMRATTGAIEEVWLHQTTFEPTCRVIPDARLEVKGQSTPPVGLCGSGLISLLAEMFITGVLDKAGNLNFLLGTPRIRRGEHGPEYVVVWAGETGHGRDIVLTKVDIDNLMRAKAAIYAGFTVLAQSVGIELEMVERILIGGAFGQYINVEKAIQLGLLPDKAWSAFSFLGNTALHGTLLALLHQDYRHQITDAASKMTYLELSADNSFYDAFTSAMFLPHTDMTYFPSVAALLESDADNGNSPQISPQQKEISS
jgi:uncharacterized 2Fe-2S/4Fe-4S cluster protein (DUF4445 family)